MNRMIHYKRKKKEIKQIFQLIKDLHNTPNKSFNLSRIYIIHVRNEVVDLISMFWEVISTKLTRISFSVHSTYFSFSQMGLNLMYHAKLRSYEMKSMKGICQKYKCLYSNQFD